MVKEELHERSTKSKLTNTTQKLRKILFLRLRSIFIVSTPRYKSTVIQPMKSSVGRAMFTRQNKKGQFFQTANTCCSCTCSMRKSAADPYSALMT